MKGGKARTVPGYGSYDVYLTSVTDNCEWKMLLSSVDGFTTATMNVVSTAE